MYGAGAGAQATSNPAFLGIVANETILFSLTILSSAITIDEI